MYTRHLCVSANEVIAEFSAENNGLSKMLGELAEACSDSGIEAALFVISLIGQNSANKELFAGDVYVFTALAALLLRSILFLFLDRTPKAEEEE